MIIAESDKNNVCQTHFNFKKLFFTGIYIFQVLHRRCNAIHSAIKTLYQEDTLPTFLNVLVVISSKAKTTFVVQKNHLCACNKGIDNHILPAGM